MLIQTDLECNFQKQLFILYLITIVSKVFDYI